MRKKATHDGLTVHAVAGTYVVLLTFTLGEADCPGLKGFAIHRTDHTDQEAGWLQGMKVFRATDPGLAPGMKHSTRLQPIQDFWWSDYTAKAGHKYTYKVVALKGDPQNLIPHAEVSVTLHAESTEGEEHGIYFNRGATASQEYSRRFGKLRPPEDNMAHPVWGWLSRGAHEAIIDFIGRAQGDTWGIRVGAYEFRLPSVSDALDKARDLGADVKILFDAGKEFPREENRAEAVRAKIKGLCKERVPKPAALSHNKFIVLLKKGKAVAVLLGSTNFSLGGVYGQSNVVHTVENSDIAAAYLDYWEQLSKNPEKAVLAPYLTENYPAPSAPPPEQGMTTVFSPQSTLDALTFYADLAAAAKHAVFMTFAFGMNAVFDEAFTHGPSGIRYALFEKLLGPGVRKEKRPAEEARMLAMRKMAVNRFAVGNHIRRQDLGGWFAEKLTGLNTHVEYVHTKFMLIDPLGESPIVVTGSANFSAASTNKNDENMLIIRGNKRVADIYLGEFMRLWEHNAFRDWIGSRPADAALEPWYLDDTDTWWQRYFGKSGYSRHREYFTS